jgi:aspartate/tyrosine/aromatic aminotransferase
VITFLAYRDENGKPWVLPFVLELEKKLVQSAAYNHEYVIFLGMESFKELAPRLILGENSPALKSGRVRTSSSTDLTTYVSVYWTIIRWVRVFMHQIRKICCLQISIILTHSLHGAGHYLKS